MPAMWPKIPQIHVITRNDNLKKMMTMMVQKLMGIPKQPFTRLSASAAVTLSHTCSLVNDSIDDRL